MFDVKGSPDWRKFALVADRCAFGLTPTRDGLPLEILPTTLDGHQGRRPGPVPAAVGAADRRLPGGQADPRDRPRPAVQDAGAGAGAGGVPGGTTTWARSPRRSPQLLVFLVKVAPGAGVIADRRDAEAVRGRRRRGGRPSSSPRSGTTSPSGSGCGPRAGRCRRCASAPGAYSEGLDTSTLLPQYKGVGILRGATDASPTVRTYLADGQDAERILTAARAAARAGRDAVRDGRRAEVDRADDRDVLADVLRGVRRRRRAALAGARRAARHADPGPVGRRDRRGGHRPSAAARGVPSVDVKLFGTVAARAAAAPTSQRGRGPAVKPLPGSG